MRWYVGFVALMAWVMAQTAAHAEPQRLALVVGNAAYVTFPKLINSVNDGRDIAVALKALRFDVVEASDVTHGLVP